MDTQEKFDDIIRSKFSEREIPFDEANWENIKKMTDAARDTKKRRRWGIIFLIGLVAGVGVTLAFLFNSNTDTKIAENKTKLPVVNNINTNTDNTNENEKNEEKTIAPLQNASDAKTTENIQTESKAITLRQAQGDNFKETKIKNTGTSPLNPIVKKAKSEPLSTTSIKKKETIKNSIKTESEINPDNIKKAKTDSTISLTVKKKKNETKNEPVRQAQGDSLKDKGKSEISIVSTPKIKTGKGDIALEAKDKGKSEATIVYTSKVETNKENSIEVKDKGKSEVSIVSTPKIKTDKEKTGELMPTKNISAPVTENQKTAVDTNVKQQLAVKGNSLITVNDTTLKPVVPLAVVAKDSTEKKEDNPLTVNPWALSVVAGVSYHERTSLLNPIGGIEITKTVNKRFKIGAGIYYTWLALSKIDCPTKTFSTVTYDFGSSNAYTELAVTKIHYGVLNLFGEFNINSKNALVAGANLYYLLTTSNTLTTYKLTYTNTPPTSITETHGYSAGLSPYDVGIMAGYRRKIIGKLEIGLYANYGLINITGKDYPISKYSAPVTLKNYSIQLQLKYKLFKK